MSIMPQGHDVFLQLSNKFNDPERELYYHLFGGKFMKRILSAFMAMLLLCLASSAVYAEDSLTAHHDCTTEHNNQYEDVAEEESPTRELTWLCVTFGCHYKDIEEPLNLYQHGKTMLLDDIEYPSRCTIAN